MTYSEALDKIHSLLTFGSRPGLDRVRELLRRMGNPQDKLSYIHVAGTNGKGSTCAMLSAVLQAAGYKTGLFISPYITDFRERIQVDNQMISEETLTAAVEETFPLVEALRDEGVIITEFEYVNALEFYIHAAAQCDVVVLETGMGGLLDCTNVILPPLCAVITTIGLDHTAILGDTIEAIAAQKCGIFKQGSHAVTSAQDSRAMAVIRQTATERKLPLTESASAVITPLEVTLHGSRFLYRGSEIMLPLSGDHQLENAKTALAAIEVLRGNHLLAISDEAIVRGMKQAVNPARLELISEQPPILLDGAHNPNGIEALKAAIDRFLPAIDITCVMGMLADKDIDSSLALLDGVFSQIYTVPIDNSRALAPELLAKKCAAHAAVAQAFDSREAAIDEAVRRAVQNNGAVLICGSLYLAGAVRPYLLAKYH
ncbi:MAG: bifunctional folylpolyglutamate synthase/dihydrofolate synthase [Ruminococcus sp.]|nr:bifunctional folylpolyglutamate synthase/dihydrofolate synthase [Ruminococcus sp.]